MTASHRKRPAPDRAGFLCACVWLSLLVPPAPAVAQVRDTATYLARMDTDGDGAVSLVEYQHWMGYAFERMDRNGDGTLSPDELPGGRGRAVTRTAHLATLAAAFRRQDLDGNGVLDTRELAAPPQ